MINNKTWCSSLDCPRWNKCDRALTDTARETATAVGCHLFAFQEYKCYEKSINNQESEPV